MKLLSFIKIPESWKNPWIKRMSGDDGVEKEERLLEEDSDDGMEKLKEENRKLRRKLKLSMMDANEEKEVMEREIQRLAKKAKSYKRKLIDMEDSMEMSLDRREAIGKKRGKKEYEEFIKKYCCVFPRNVWVWERYPKFQNLYLQWVGREQNIIRELQAQVREKDLIIQNYVPIAQEGLNYELVKQLHLKTEEARRARNETKRIAVKMCYYETPVEFEHGTVAQCDSTTNEYGDDVRVAANLEDSDNDVYDEEEVVDDFEGEEFEGEYDPDPADEPIVF